MLGAVTFRIPSSFPVIGKFSCPILCPILEREEQLILGNDPTTDPSID